MLSMLRSFYPTVLPTFTSIVNWIQNRDCPRCVHCVFFGMFVKAGQLQPKPRWQDYCQSLKRLKLTSTKRRSVYSNFWVILCIVVGVVPLTPLATVGFSLRAIVARVITNVGFSLLRTPPHNLNLNYRWFQFSVFNGECYRIPKTSHMYIFYYCRLCIILYSTRACGALLFNQSINHIWIIITTVAAKEKCFFYFPYII
jgi:hypothetical protein